MKILVAGPEIQDFFTHNIIHASRMMGHDSMGLSTRQMGFSFRSPITRGINEIMLKVSNSWRNSVGKAVIEQARKFKPALTIVSTRTLEPDIVEDLRKASGGLVICWYADHPAYVSRDHIVSNEYDAVFLKDKEFAVSLRDIVGINAHHLQEACNPAWHKLSHHRSNNQLVVSGTSYGYRNKVIEKLDRERVEIQIYGNNPSSWASPIIKSKHSGIYLDHLNKSEVFGRAAACLNTFHPAERNSLNCRIFETCGCGGLLLSEKKPAIDSCFEDGKDYLSFSSFEELKSHLKRIGANRQFGKDIRISGNKRAHAEHTYAHRIQEIIDTLSLS